MPDSSRPLLAVALVLAALLALVPAAEAKRKVPRQFMGVNFDSSIAGAPDKVWRAQFPRMAAAGVESTRTVFWWAEGQPTENGPIRLADTDRIVAAAAARRLRVLPTVILAPPWARSNPYEGFSPARDPESMRRYVHALVDRYGPRGSFWAEHPGLPRVPIREWQFWNEPQFHEFWTIPEDGEWWAASYTRQLRVFHEAVKERDPGARVVLAGLANDSWNRLRDLYVAGAGDAFEIAATHPYTAKPGEMIAFVRRFRAEMTKHGDARAPLLVTELGVPAAEGSVRHAPAYALKTTRSGMAKWLTTAYRRLAAQRRKLGVTRVYWYSWATEYKSDDDPFRFAGLFKWRRGMSHAVAEPAYRSYVKVARLLEGCTKNRAGRCRTRPRRRSGHGR